MSDRKFATYHKAGPALQDTGHILGREQRCANSMLVTTRRVKDLGEASSREASGWQDEASGPTHKENVPGSRHWILDEILAASCGALYERQNSVAVGLADVTCLPFR